MDMDTGSYSFHHLHDKTELEAFLRRDVFLHIYSIGDLDDFFWPHTTWYGCKNGSDLQAVLLQYSPGGFEVLLALCQPGQARPMMALLQNFERDLPDSFHLHTSESVERFFFEGFDAKDLGLHDKMALRNPRLIRNWDTSIAEAAGDRDLGQLSDLYARSYPDNAFDPRMLETGQFYCIKSGGRIVSAAGIHVFSKKYRVAAIGNVVTDPEFRGNGLGTAVTARTVQSLLRHVDHIGLNVKANNQAALRSYQKLGFEPYTTYREAEIKCRIHSPNS